MPAEAAISNCTPTAGFTACKRITYSGSDQTFTIPTGVTSIQARVWGAAGGGANSGWTLNQGGGAGGGFAQGTVAVTAGQTLTVVVGEGGSPSSLVTTYGGGGQGGDSSNLTARGSSGGGMSGVFAPGGKTPANARVIAGGGGGASPGSDNGPTGEGGGGGLTGGQDTMPDRSGRGGTQAAGGAAATTNSSCNVLPTAGAQFQGGRGGDSSLSNPHEGGGGGGGGYFGGGGGMCQSTSNSNQNGGGGGGSSFVTGTGVTAGTTTAGANFIATGSNCTGTAASGGAADALYTSGIGLGSCYGTGGNGEVVIQYRIATLRVAKTSVGAVGTFNIAADNGFGSDSLTTVTSGTQVTGSARPLTNSDTATTVTETIPAGYVVSGISCTGLGAGSATYNLAAGTAILNAAATASTNDITCAYTNSKLPTIRLTKVSNGGTGTFNFSGDNGFGTDSIVTVTAGTGVNGAVKMLSNFSTATTITEAIPSSYFISGISCSGLGGGTATTDFNAGTVLLNAAATAPGASITCTYTNTLAVTALLISKSANTAGPVSAGQTITYTFQVTNSGNRPLSAVTVSETFNGYGTAPVPGSETLTTDAAPAGDSSNGTANDGIWQTLGVGDTVTFTATYVVHQSDIDNLQ